MVTTKSLVDKRQTNQYEPQKIIIDEEFKTLCLRITEEEGIQLRENIKENGFRDPIVVWKGRGILLDGHNRYRIWLLKFDADPGLAPDIVEVELEDRDAAKAWIAKNQLGRRNLNNFQRAELALVMKPDIEKKAKENQGSRTDILQNSVGSKGAQKQLAEIAGVSHDTIHKTETILEKADSETIEKVRSGEESINRVYADITRKENREVRHEQMSPQALPRKKYSVIYADPPWQYDFSRSPNRAIENQYPTMSLDEICELDVESIAADHCVLFLWVTNPKAEEAYSVVRSWGFKYKSQLMWDKEKMGMGYYARQQHEQLLICTKGNPPVPAEEDRPASAVRHPRGKHSQKPSSFYKIIETMYPKAARIELFSRGSRDGWDKWGNEA